MGSTDKNLSQAVAYDPRTALGLGIFGIRIWGFPKIRGTFLGVLIIRTIVYWGLYRGPLILGNYHVGFRVEGLGFGLWGLGMYAGHLCCSLRGKYFIQYRTILDDS